MVLRGWHEAQIVFHDDITSFASLVACRDRLIVKSHYLVRFSKCDDKWVIMGLVNKDSLQESKACNPPVMIGALMICMGN